MRFEGTVARRRRAGSVLAVALLCVAASVWRLSCVRLGPDPDTDAYAHYVIARQLLDTPENLRIHWVWLPLYHAFVALGIVLGASLDGVRSANAVLAAIPALMIALWVGKDRCGTADHSLVALSAASLTLLAPLGLQLGTTGQMELSLTCSLMGAAFALSRERYALAALLLSLAVMLRYESWFLVALIALVWVARRAREERPALGLLACWLCPAFTISAWAALRASQGEDWFWFIRANQAFAEHALTQLRETQHGRLEGLARYTIALPALQFGLAAPFALLGLRRTLAVEGPWFVLLPLGVLCFLTASAMSRSQLGLERHFLPLVPFMAIWIAHGLARTSEWLGVLLAPARDARSLLVGQTGARGPVSERVHAVLSYSALALLALRVPAVLEDWRDVTRSALPAERAVAAFLARVPAGARIVCDEAAPEVLSGLSAERFVRTFVGPDALEMVLTLARDREVFVLTRANRIGAFARLGDLVYGGPALPFAVVRVRPGLRNLAAAARGA